MFKIRVTGITNIFRLSEVRGLVIKVKARVALGLELGLCANNECLGF